MCVVKVVYTDMYMQYAKESLSGYSVTVADLAVCTASWEHFCLFYEKRTSLSNTFDVFRRVIDFFFFWRYTEV